MNRKESAPLVTKEQEDKSTIVSETNSVRRTASLYKDSHDIENGLLKLGRDDFLMDAIKRRGGQNALETHKNLPINKSPFYKYEGG